MKLDAGQSFDIIHEIEQVEGELCGFGGWFSSSGSIHVEISGSFPVKTTITTALSPNWGKYGAIWISSSNETAKFEIKISSLEDTNLALYGVQCGLISHPHLSAAAVSKPSLLSNIHQIAPEAIFISKMGATILPPNAPGDDMELILKSCNRCARFLPINTYDERIHLSFSNHCVASHRRPCSHSGFGKLLDDSGSQIKLEYGYQLECRFCKKFEVNAAHNPRRTGAQMKEDGARRRHFELLLAWLNGGKSDQLAFRDSHHGEELADYIWKKFGGSCFNCKKKISSQRAMHLDHTRPLALLWPLDETATCLCGECNGAKRDRSPSDFYTEDQLTSLSEITGIPLPELLTPGPNEQALDELEGKVASLKSEFLHRPELQKTRDGKLTADLVEKAIRKVAHASSYNRTTLKGLGLD